jgi:hypothetical protein
MNDKELLEECRRFFEEQERKRLESFHLTINTVVLNDGSHCRIKRQHLISRELKSFETLANHGGGSVTSRHGAFSLLLWPDLLWADVELYQIRECIGVTTIVWSEDSWPSYFRYFRRFGQRLFGFTSLPLAPQPKSPWMASLLSRRGLQHPAENLGFMWKAAVGSMDLIANRCR